MRSNVSRRYSKIELMEMYKTPSKYLWVGIDLIFQNVTAKSISIVKCMGKYENVVTSSFQNDATTTLNMMYNNV